MYEYGMKGAPAVGGGLPGLPRRTAPAPEPQREIPWKPYRLLTWAGSTASNVRIYDLKGGDETIHIPDAGSLISTSLSWDQTVLASVATAYGSCGLFLVDLDEGRHIGSADLLVDDCYGVAVSTKLGLVALSFGGVDALTGPGGNPATIRIYRLSDFVGDETVSIGDIDPVFEEVIDPGGFTAIGSMDWSRDGDTLVMGCGPARATYDGRHGSSVFQWQARSWPDFRVIATSEEAGIIKNLKHCNAKNVFSFVHRLGGNYASVVRLRPDAGDYDLVVRGSGASSSQAALGDASYSDRTWGVALHYVSEGEIRSGRGAEGVGYSDATAGRYPASSQLPLALQLSRDGNVLVARSGLSTSQALVLGAAGPGLDAAPAVSFPSTNSLFARVIGGQMDYE